MNKLPQLWLLLGAVAFLHAASTQEVPVTIESAARAQIGVTLGYDPRYVTMDYPGGDVPKVSGVCTDVVVRALREVGIDLQKEVHEDMAANFSKYPQNWGLSRPDKNIDHRRVPNLMRYFERKGYALAENAEFLAGDLVAWKLGNGLLHVGVVSGKKSTTGTPLVIHNIGSGAQEEDVLRAFDIIGHYRVSLD